MVGKNDKGNWPHCDDYFWPHLGDGFSSLSPGPRAGGGNFLSELVLCHCRIDKSVHFFPAQLQRLLESVRALPRLDDVRTVGQSVH